MDVTADGTKGSKASHRVEKGTKDPGCTKELVEGEVIDSEGKDGYI